MINKYPALRIPREIGDIGCPQAMTQSNARPVGKGGRSGRSLGSRGALTLVIYIV